MTAVTTNQDVDVKHIHADPQGMTQSYQVASSTTIYKNTFVALNESGYLTSYVAPTSDTTEYGNLFVGLSLENVDNSSGSDGDLRCEVLIHGMLSNVALSTATVADIGHPVFITDNATLSTTAANGSYLGRVTNLVASGYVNVAMSPFLDNQVHNKYLCGVSPILDLTTANDIGKIFMPQQNPNGMIVTNVFAIAASEIKCGTTDGVITLYDTGDTTSTITLTTADALPANDIICAAGTAQTQSAANTWATNDPVWDVPAGLGVYAKVTTAVVDTTAAGTCRVYVEAMLE